MRGILFIDSHHSHLALALAMIRPVAELRPPRAKELKILICDERPWPKHVKLDQELAGDVAASMSIPANMNDCREYLEPLPTCPPNEWGQRRRRRTG